MRCIPALREGESVIVTILGGSAQSTPWLLDWLGQRVLNAEIVVRLAGRNNARLLAVARACRVLASSPCIEIQEYGAEEWAESLANADVVIIQIRIGGYEARAHDEFFPLKYGIPGDEGLGPGGLSAAVRTWPRLRELLMMLRTCAPAALPILLTSPAGLLLRLAALEFPGWKIYGICELPFTTLQRICTGAGLRMENLVFSYVGVNHLGWLYGIREGAHDVIYRYGRQQDSPLGEIVRRWHAVPLKYLRLHFEKSAVVEEQRRTGEDATRSRKLMNLRERSMLAFEGCAGDIRRVLSERVADWYTEGLGPLLLELMEGSDGSRPFFLTVPARGQEGLCERPYRLCSGCFVPMRMEPAPALARDLVDSFLGYEAQAAQAIFDRCARRLADAVRAHPWVERSDDARRLAGEIIQCSGSDQQWMNLEYLN